MFALNVNFSFMMCRSIDYKADLRPEPAIITTSYASFARAGMSTLISNNFINITWVIIIFVIFMN